jgi:hypothetical protein
MKDNKEEGQQQQQQQQPKQQVLSSEFNPGKIAFAFNSKFGINLDPHMQYIEKAPDFKKLFSNVGNKIINEMKKDFDKKEIEYNNEIKELNKSYEICNGKDKCSRFKEEEGIESQLKKIKFTNDLKDAWEFIISNSRKLNDIHNEKFNEQKRPNKDLLVIAEEGETKQPVLKKARIQNFNENPKLNYDDEEYKKLKNLMEQTYLKCVSDKNAFLYNLKK